MSLPRSVRVASFDLGGTLLDAERGLVEAVRDSLGGGDPARLRLLAAARADAELELLEELEDYRPYAEVLAETLLSAAPRAGLTITAEQARAVAATLPDWPFFEDAVPALERIAARFPVAFVTNADRADWERLARRLPFRAARAVTGSDVLCYKPEADHLLALLHELELDEEELLHVSALPELDLATAEDLGIPHAYLDRFGEPLPEEITALVTVKTMTELADWMLAAPPPARRRAAPRRTRGEFR
jgi:2-haloalkanoic acid dehalogenase type II